MFEVREQTARELFLAQQPELQGILRLDFSAHFRSTGRDQPLNILAARVVIGEQFVDLVTRCAVEAVELKDRTGFHLHAVPPAPDSLNRLLLMPNRYQFEPFVTFRLDREFGLARDNRYYQPALKGLALDFYDWCLTPNAQSEFQIQTDDGRVFILCGQPALSKELTALEPTKRLELPKELEP
jgi:hypothetical protein